MHKLKYKNKEITIIPTAHISKISAMEVKQIIEDIKPDSVCIELDQERYNSLNNPHQFENMDIFQIIKNKKTGFLIVNIILSSYQKRAAKKLSVQAGQEMIQAITSAKENNSAIILADRNIQTTFSRIYRKISFLQKLKLITVLVNTIFDKTELNENEIENLKQNEFIDNALSSINKDFPILADILIHERDQVLAHNIKNAPGEKIVAVLGAAHVQGVIKAMDKETAIEELYSIPPKKPFITIVGFFLAFIFIIMILYTLFNNPQNGIKQINSWFLWNGTLSALGVSIALGHPLSILTALIMAPITSLSPLLAAGWFAGLTEAFLRKPKVKDFKNINEDLNSIKGIYKNRITRILLVIILANLFSTLGTFIGGFDVIKIFVENLLP